MNALNLRSDARGAGRELQNSLSGHRTESTRCRRNSRRSAWTRRVRRNGQIHNTQLLLCFSGRGGGGCSAGWAAGCSAGWSAAGGSSSGAGAAGAAIEGSCEGHIARNQNLYRSRSEQREGRVPRATQGLRAKQREGRVPKGWAGGKQESRTKKLRSAGIWGSTGRARSASKATPSRCEAETAELTDSEPAHLR